jgi:hypothetical protein
MALVQLDQQILEILQRDHLRVYFEGLVARCAQLDPAALAAIEGRF